MSEAPRVGIVGGGGWLGGAIARSILNAGVTSSEGLTVSYRSEPPTCFHGVHLTKDNQELIDRSDVIVISVRPADWPSITVVASDRLVISVMAGIKLRQLSDRLTAKRVVRSLPNAAAEVGKSYTPWVATRDVDDRDRSIVRRIFDACGSDDEVSSENEIDYLTGLAGSGPAFPALLATAMMRAAAAHGLGPDIARRAATAVLIGAGRLLELRNEDPAETVEMFVNYRGTTAAAIAAMHAAGFEAAVANGLSAALHKSMSMGELT
jgi:pyrroline-5-carboxylate reductase